MRVLAFVKVDTCKGYRRVCYDVVCDIRSEFTNTAEIKEEVQNSKTFLHVKT